MQIGVMMALARLLAPSDFGLMAIAAVAIRFVSYFAQLGVTQVVVQRPQLGAGDLRVAFTLSWVVGGAFLCLVWFVAPLVAAAFRTGELTPVLRVMAFNLPLSAAAAVSLGSLSKAMEFRRLAAVEVASYGLGFAVVGVSCALAGLGVWSLVAAMLVQQSATLMLAYAFVRHPLRPKLSGPALRTIASYGSRYSLSGFLEFIGASLDTVFIGRLLGERALGLYNRSMALAALPLQSAVNVVSKVLFPAMTTVQAEPAKLAKVYLVAVFVVAAIGGSTGIGAAIASEDIVACLLGPTWGEARPIFGVLALAVPLGLLTHLSGIVCDAQAWLALKLKIQLATIAVLLVAMLALYKVGIVGFALAVLLGEWFRAGVYLVAVGRGLKLSGVEAMLVLGAAIGVCLASGGAVGLARWLGPAQSTAWLRLAMQMFAGAVALAVSLAVAWSFLGRLPSFVEAEARIPFLRSVGRRGRAAVRLLKAGAEHMHL